MRPRRAYAFLLTVFAISRIAYYLLGVRFDARPIFNFFQFLDPELLKHRLLESLLYLHVQPPGFNLYVALILKLFPAHYAEAFHAVHLTLGAASCCLIYHLMRICGVGSSLAFVLTGVFVVSPGVVLFENFMLYEYLVMFLLLAVAAALYHLIRCGSFVYMLMFFAGVLSLCLVRNFFHVLYLIAAFLFLFYTLKECRKKVFLAGIVPVLIVLGWCSKNWFLFGSFSTSTWLGMNLNTITTHQLTKGEAADFVQRGVISAVSSIDAGAPIASYRPYVASPPRTGIPVLDQELTPAGATNFNNSVFFAIQRHYEEDALQVLRQYPAAYLRSLEAAWFSYFLPAGDFPFFDLNRPKIRAMDRFINIAFFGQFKDASDRKKLRSLAAQGNKAALIPYTGTFLLIGLPVLWGWGMCYVANGIRRKTLERPVAILIAFLLFNITYITGIANFLSSFENNRYRFPCDALFVVLLGIAIERWRGLNALRRAA
jgi:hypothetical protein